MIGGVLLALVSGACALVGVIAADVAARRRRRAAVAAAGAADGAGSDRAAAIIDAPADEPAPS